MAGGAHHIPELDSSGLRQFALTTGGIVAVLFGLFFPWLLEFSIPTWPWVVAGVMAVWGMAAPASLRPVYRLWMRFGLLLSRVTTPLVLGILFYLVFVPIALFMRVIGRDPMNRTMNGKAESYRVPSQAAPRENMEKPF